MHLRHLSLLTLAPIGAAAAAQQAAPAVPPAAMAQMQRAAERARTAPDTGGTGRYPAIKEEDPSLPNHVVYRPADLTKLGSARLPILVWGNGGCSNDGAGARGHLMEIASHGYLVIASGTIRSGPGAPPQPPRPPQAMPKPGEPFVPPPPQTSAALLTEAIGWAKAQGRRPGSPYRGRLAADAVAVSGWSCGGVQALEVAADPRVRAVIIHNSGILPEGGKPLAGMELTKAALGRLHTPILYILGGATDVAYANGMDDFARITAVPAMVASLDVGHGGTFFEPNGGKVTPVDIAWLDWRLKGDLAASTWFVGADCRLCTDKAWTVSRKGL